MKLNLWRTLLVIVIVAAVANSICYKHKIKSLEKENQTLHNEINVVRSLRKRGIK